MSGVFDPRSATTPAVVIVEPPATVDLMAEVRDRYMVFRNKRALSAAPSLVEDVGLSGGGRVRFVSLPSGDTVYVWGVSLPGGDKLYHGIVVLAGWASSALHRQTDSAGGSVFDRPCEQISDGTEEYHHRTVTEAGADGQTFVPAVLRTTEKAWDLWRRDGVASFESGDLPLLANYSPAGPEYVYASKEKLKDSSGSTLFLVPALTSEVLDDTTDPTRLPCCASGDGKFLAFRQKRVWLESPTLGYYRVRYGFRTSQLADDGTFGELSAETAHSFRAPLPETTITSTTGDDGIDEAVDSDVHVTTLAPSDGGSVVWTFNQEGITGPAFTGIVMGFFWTTSNKSVSSKRGGWSKRADSGGENVIDNLFPVGKGDSLKYCKLTSRINYPVTSTWQGGQASVSLDRDSNGYGVASHSRTKRTADWRVAGSPEVTLTIDDLDIVLFSGTTTGVLEGHHHESTEVKINAYTDQGSYLSDNGGWLIPKHASWGDYYGQKITLDLLVAQATPQENYDLVLANAINFYAIYDAYTPGTTTTEEKLEPSTTGEYTFTSRYILDADTRVGFYAFLRVRVACSGASWSQVADSFLGDMLIDGDASYTFEMAFEWQYGATKGEEVIHSSSFTKPPTEFTTTGTGDNPLIWPTEASDFTQIYLHMPPNVSPPVEAFTHLDNLTLHQGINTNLAGGDTLTGTEQQSETGLEASVLDNGTVFPYEAKPMGVLYARTFTPAALPGAVWLLSTLGVDIKKQGLSEAAAQTAPSYYYAPAVLEAINKSYHFEVTERGIEYWSDGIAAADGSTIPSDRTKRDIKIFYV